MNRQRGPVRPKSIFRSSGVFLLAVILEAGVSGVVRSASPGPVKSTAVEPADPAPCSGVYSTVLDEDGDHYTNADEIDNGTDPCSAASVPPDFDGDFISDLNDPDDDNDGLPDTSDPFALDPNNGATTNLPVNLTFDPGGPPPGGLLNLGFTGLMTNGVTNYANLYDPALITAGGASGLFTISAVPDGVAFSNLNSARNAFQFGLNVTPATGVFTAQTRIVAPFAGLVPADYQSMGMFVGNGDQDNYAMLEVIAGGIEIAREIGGAFAGQAFNPVPMPGPDFIDLFEVVDPSLSTVQAAYQVTTGGVAAPVVFLGSPISVPPSWFAGPRGLAIGMISTSFGPGAPFPATWDFLQARGGGVSQCASDAACADTNPCTDDACVAGVCVHSSNTALCDDGRACTTGDICSGGVCVGTDACPQGQSCSLAGACVSLGEDPDNDGLGGASDPCPFDPRNRCVGPVATDTATGNAIRIHTGAGGLECSGTKVDCNGQTWLSDFGSNQPGSYFACDLNGGGDNCVLSGVSAIFGCEDAATDDIFQCERWDPPDPPELAYTFTVPNGRYLVNLLFANVWGGTVFPGDRLFDIIIQGQLTYASFDQVAASGGGSKAVVRSAEVNVQNGQLTIGFGHVQQNPSIKGIEVLREDRDGDGYFPPDDCDDLNPAIHPGAPDALCDGVDDNCNGQADEEYVPVGTTCGVGACGAAGLLACTSGVLVNTCVPGAPTTEICDGLDNDCNGIVDDAVAPAGIPAETASESDGTSVTYSWPPIFGATAYDVVRGDLLVLAATRGDFSQAVNLCAADNTPAMVFADADLPAEGNGFFYLLRAVNCVGVGTYDGGDPAQVGSRDAEIGLSPAACP